MSKATRDAQSTVGDKGRVAGWFVIRISCGCPKTMITHRFLKTGPATWSSA